METSNAAVTFDPVADDAALNTVSAAAELEGEGVTDALGVTDDVAEEEGDDVDVPDIVAGQDAVPEDDDV